MSLRPTWQILFPAFDPLVPAGGDVVRVERPYTPLGELTDKLGFPAGKLRELIVGAAGSGKTTELRALQVRAKGLLSVQFDVHQHFHDRGDPTALERLQAWELLLLVGLAVYRFGEEGLGHTWSASRPRALKEAIAAATAKDAATVDLPGLLGEVALLASMSALPGAAPAVRALTSVLSHVTADLQLAGPSRDDRPDGDPAVQGLVLAVNGLLVELHERYRLHTLLLLDGVDRGNQELARRLFERSTLLTQLEAHVVMTAPLSLRHRNLNGWTSHFLGNVPVLAPEAPLVPAGRTDFFRELWRRRAGPHHALIADAHIDRLAWASGGIVRQFCVLIQGVIRRGWSADQPVDTAMVEAEIDTCRRNWEADVNQSTVELLRRVLAARDLVGDEREPRLLDERCIVAWPNASVWYFPHPLLLLRKVPLT